MVDESLMFQGRPFVLGFNMVMLAPGERRELVGEPAESFVPEAILIPRPMVPDPPWWRVQCFLIGLWTNILASLVIIGDRIRYGEWNWAPFYVRPPDERFLVNVEIGGVPQFAAVGEGVSVEAFDPDGLGLALKFDVVSPGRPIKLIVENRSDRKVDFVCAIKGTC